MSDTASSAGARAVALLELGRPAEAERELRRGLASSPHDLQMHVDLTRALLMQERLDEAMEASAQALSLAPDHPFVLYIRSLAQGAIGDLAAGLGTIDSALRLAPEASRLHRHRGSLLHQQDRPAEALISFERARALDPEDAEVVAAIAGALHDLRRDDEAESAIADALALDPECAAAHHIRSLQSMRSGATADALDASRDAVRLDPTNAVTKEQLAVAMKARNPLYRVLWSFCDWFNGQTDPTRVAITVAPLLLSRFLQTFDDALWAQAVLAVLVSFVALTWLLEPLMNTVIMCSRYGRGLLPKVTRQATYAFVGFALVAPSAVIVGISADVDAMFLVALSSVVWAAIAGSIPGIPVRHRVLFWIGTSAAGALTAISIPAAVIGASLVWPVTLALLLTGVAALWGSVALRR
ncbi:MULTISPECIES: tetratricopeptide repeat protein [unclassified Knoellia]|uniref:tetratricopeptide repeat protein n=1 Tax=Knoellia altitudinis TaxID=3404795 RepID=UPI0036223827